MSGNTKPTQILINKISTLIKDSKQKVATSINTEISLLYWNIGNHINKEILNNQRAEYGKQIIASLSEYLTLNFGKGWSEKQLRQCMQFATTFESSEIVYTLCRQLSWSHIRLVMYMDNDIKRSFYIQMCIHEKWSVRTFGERIKSLLYERTAISKNPEETIKKDILLLEKQKTINPDLVFKDPYLLNFLELNSTYSEKDLENNILAELQSFIIELGSDFAFMARQKRITIDNRDYYIDLLFYHRRLKTLVAIDLKIGEFEASYKGQMELYLNYLNKYEIMEGENSPIGLILCAGKNDEHIELMQLEKSNIKVAEYLTILPPTKILQDKLHRAIEIAHSKLDNDNIIADKK